NIGAGSGRTESGSAAVIIHGIETELGIQRLSEIAECQAPLPTVPSITISTTLNQRTLRVLINGQIRTANKTKNSVDASTCSRVIGQQTQVIVATIGDDVWLGEE